MLLLENLLKGRRIIELAQAYARRPVGDVRYLQSYLNEYENPLRKSKSIDLIPTGGSES